MAGLDSSIANLERRKRDLERYSYIINSFRHTDVSQDETFQRTFTHFYRVRRNSDWRQVYYRLFEESKQKVNISFEAILRAIYVSTGRIEASFSSKMLATLNPEMPIWDSIVLSKLGKKPKQNLEKEERLRQSVQIYKAIISWYEDFKREPEAKRFTEAFDCAFPEYKGFSAIKKIDFLIWGSGESELFNNENAG